MGRCAVDLNGDVYVADCLEPPRAKFTATGAYLTQWGTQGAGPGSSTIHLGSPRMAPAMSSVSEIGNSRIQRFAAFLPPRRRRAGVASRRCTADGGSRFHFGSTFDSWAVWRPGGNVSGSPALSPGRSPRPGAAPRVDPGVAEASTWQRSTWCRPGPRAATSSRPARRPSASNSSSVAGSVPGSSIGERDVAAGAHARLEVWPGAARQVHARERDMRERLRDPKRERVLDRLTDGGGACCRAR